MMRLNDCPQGTRDSVISRIPLKKLRENTTIEMNKPLESFYGVWDWRRELSEGWRNSKTKAIYMGSFAVPLLLTANAASVGGDSGGTLVFLVCCGLALYLFGLTGWKNEEP